MNRLLCLAFLLPVTATAAAKSPELLIERIERDLARDRAFSAGERESYLAEFRQQLGSYAFDVLKGRKVRGAEVVTTIVMEGSFEGVAVERTVGVAVAAYVAIGRGAPPDLAEGIALYGFRKKLGADRIATWANGANDLIRFGVPHHIAKDLVYNAAEHDWDAETFNLLKWGLVQAAKAELDLDDFNTYLIGHFLEGKTRPGEMVGNALRALKQAAASGTRPTLPAYESPCKPVPEVAVTPEAAPGETEPEPRGKTPRHRRPSVLTSLDRSIGTFLGTPYVWGGRTRRGTDCSGFVQTVFAEAGIALPRSSVLQWKAGTKVSDERLSKGDLVFFRTVAHRISHVGIVTDPVQKQFVHASSSRGVVRSDLNSKYYRKRYAGARRVIPRP